MANAAGIEVSHPERRRSRCATSANPRSAGSGARPRFGPLPIGKPDRPSRNARLGLLRLRGRNRAVRGLSVETHRRVPNHRIDDGLPSHASISGNFSDRPSLPLVKPSRELASVDAEDHGRDRELIVEELAKDDTSRLTLSSGVDATRDRSAEATHHWRAVAVRQRIAERVGARAGAILVTRKPACEQHRSGSYTGAHREPVVPPAEVGPVTGAAGPGAVLHLPAPTIPFITRTPSDRRGQRTKTQPGKAFKTPPIEWIADRACKL